MPPAPESSITSVEIVVVCATDEEYEALKKASGVSWKAVPVTGNDAYSYEFASVETKDGKPIRVVSGVAPHMGMTPSAVMTTKMILRFRPRLVAMVGVAGGVLKEGRSLGDILVPDVTFDYESGKLTRHDDGVVTLDRSPTPLDVNTALTSRVKTYATREVLDRIAYGYGGPLSKDRLAVHVGPVGTGAIVVDDRVKVQEIKEFSRKLVGFEMELYAVHRACKEARTSVPLFLGMKSIMDFGQNKTDDAKHYAAYTSSEFFWDFIKGNWASIPSSDAHPSREQSAAHLNDVIRLGVESLQLLLKTKARINGRYFVLSTKDDKPILRRMDHLHVEGVIMTGEQGLDFAFVDSDDLVVCEAVKRKKTIFKKLSPPTPGQYSPRIAHQIDPQQKWVWCTPVFRASEVVGVVCFFGRDAITMAEDKVEAIAPVLVQCARALASGLATDA